ncbi:class I SAM-dependent methyltransferase [Pseudonocardia sichuanensis]
MNHYGEYDASAPYLHLLSESAWVDLGPRLADALAGADPAAGPVLELGAGTGLGTERILAAVPDSPVLAAEPSAALRAVLIARLRGMTGGERVTVLPVGAAEVDLPERLAAVVGMHMVGHLAPDTRRALWRGISARLAPGAPVVLNVQPPETATAVPAWPPFGVRQGALTYQGTGSAEPTGPESVRWRMQYATLCDGVVVEEAEAEYEWWVLSAAGLAAELTEAGLHSEVNGDLVVARSSGKPLS